MQLSMANPLPTFDAELAATQCDEVRTRFHGESRIPLQLMHGDGNVIGILAGYREMSALTERAATAKEICDRITALRVDGVGFVHWATPVPQFWFHDRDGTYEPTCGNGLRCATRLLDDLGRLRGRAEILTDNGPRRIRMEQRQPVVSVGAPRRYRTIGSVLDFVYTDIPHAVVLCERLDEIDVVTEGAELAHDERLCRMVGHPEGVHVDFVETTTAGINVRTYEIGVEDETRACGTGAAAAAYVASRRGFHTMPIAARMWGGTLVVTAERGELLITGQVEYLLSPHFGEG